MPSYYQLPAQFANASVEDNDRFQKLPFYLVKNEIRQYARWSIFDQLYGKIDWEPNMGNVMRGVTPQSSPVGQSFFFPNFVTVMPQKDMHEVTESVENEQVRWHRFESKQFSFVPSFNSFWRDHIQYADNDLAKHIQIANNNFIRTRMWSKSPYVWIAGVGLQAAPTVDLEPTLSALGTKSLAWLQAILPTVKQSLTLRQIYSAALSLKQDLAAPPFEGVMNMPKENNNIAEKYVLILDDEAFSNFLFDNDVANLKSIQLDLLFNDFKGLLFGNITTKCEPFPLRFDINGNAVAPEIQDALTNKRVPNPLYTTISQDPKVGCAYSVAWLLGADAYKTIKVGPPPKEFATQSMKANKFYNLRWNGEISLTDQILITYPDGSIDLNRYGTQLQLISQLTLGVLGGEVRWAIPIIYARKRPAQMV